ncbi:MAG TPA: hypothetical protein VGM69_15990 [Chloroflexota bacterium]|jgi:hypothetical protein
MAAIGSWLGRAGCALAIALIAVGVASAGPDEPNLLRNPSFEGGTYHASMSSFIADGWSYWFQHRGANDPGWWLPEPEYGLIIDRPGQARSGIAAHRWFNSWAVHNAGLYQIATVPEGAWLRFSIGMLNWSSGKHQFGVSEGVHRKWVGVDPAGGTDAFDPRVVWSGVDTTMDRWVELAVTAQAQGDRVTVFVRNRPEWPLEHNDVLVDDASLTVVEPPADPHRAALLAAPTEARRPRFDGDPVEIAGGRSAYGTLRGGAAIAYGFGYPGGEVPYTINVQTWPDDAVSLARFAFRVFGPRWDDLYVMSEGQPGAIVDVVGRLPVGERGRYRIELSNRNPAGEVAYRIWLSGPGLGDPGDPTIAW